MTGARFRRAAVPLLALLAAFGAWEFAVQVAGVPRTLLPPPSAVAARMWRSHPLLVKHLGLTLLEAVAGFGIGGGCGFVLAVAISRSPLARAAIEPVVTAFAAVPKVALAPLLVLWAGYGLTPKILMAALLCFFPVVVNVVRGLSSVPHEVDLFLRAIGAGRWARFWRVELPFAAPAIFDGCKIAVTLATIGAIVGEFANPSHGLGFLMEVGRENFEPTLQFAAVLLVSLLGWGLYELVGVVERVGFGTLIRPPGTELGGGREQP